VKQAGVHHGATEARRSSRNAQEEASRTRGQAQGSLCQGEVQIDEDEARRAAEDCVI